MPRLPANATGRRLTFDFPLTLSLEVTYSLSIDGPSESTDDSSFIDIDLDRVSLTINHTTHNILTSLSDEDKEAILDHIRSEDDDL